MSLVDMDYWGLYLLLSDGIIVLVVGWLPSFLPSSVCPSVCYHSFIHPAHSWVAFDCVLVLCWHLVVWKRRWVPSVWISFPKFSWWLALPGYPWDFGCPWDVLLNDVFAYCLFCICFDFFFFLTIPVLQVTSKSLLFLRIAFYFQVLEELHELIFLNH